MQIIVKPLKREALLSSIAQSVEHSAVNRSVVGSSPTWGARLTELNNKRNPARQEEIRLRGQVVKTSPFHGGNTSSSLVGVIFGALAQLVRATGS